YVVTNNSDAFTWTGTLSDDTLGPINGSITLAPGESKSFNASGTISGVGQDTGTASGACNVPGRTRPRSNADATVTGHVCTISLTKTPAQTNVCNGSTVGYTYVVTNNSDAFTWTGTLTDDKLGAINGSITLAPGGSQTLNASAVINGV